jgi:ABC-2 type transport system ATP-binding protein
MIEVQDLVKWYGPVLAVDHLSFVIPEGKIVGFLGPNGAGKTTTIRILTGFLPPSAGRAVIAGYDVLKQADDARRMIGYLPQSTPLYQEMRVDEYLHYRGKLHGMKRTLRKQRIDEVAARCGLEQIKHRVIGHLSGGNQQRVGLAQALLHEPKVLILDEPTAGFDPTQVSQVRQLIQELREKHTILLSTHILPEVEQIADEVIIIAGGRIAARGKPAELRESVGTRGAVLLEVKAAQEAVAKALGAVPGVRHVDAQPQHEGWCRATVTSQNGQDLREPLGKAVAGNGWTVREMRHETATLEQFFIQITATQTREKPAVA